MDLEDELKQRMQVVGQKQLDEYRKRLQQKFREITNERDKLINGYHNFKLQLITLSGGTISVFIALQGNKDIDIFIKLGFALLGVSLLCGIISLYFDLVGDEQNLALQEEFDLSSRRIELEAIEKFGKLDVTIEKEMHKISENTAKAEKERLNKRYGNITKLLKHIYLDAQKIEDGQLLFFLGGILLIILGLFI